jgi:hypothetical protein
MIDAALAEAEGRVSGPAGAGRHPWNSSVHPRIEIRSLNINKHSFKTAMAPTI